MATTIGACGGECGVLTPGGHISLIAGTPTFSTTTFRSGLRSIRCNAAAAAVTYSLSEVESGQLTANGVGVLRFYIYFATALPDGDTILADATFVKSCGLFFQASDSKLYSRANGVNGATGATVTTGTWYLIDMRLTADGTASNVTVDVTVNGVALTSPAAGLNGGASNRWRLGVVAAVTADVFFDDILASGTSIDYPLGGGYILSYIPNADGTHNVAGANDFERTLTGTDIDNSTTDAYELVNDRPMESAAGDFINGKAPPNSTDYVEIAYEDSVESAAPRSVEAIVGYHDAGGAGTNNFSVTLRSGATTADIMAAATRNVGATMSWGRAHFTTIPGGTAWTLAAFNALLSRLLVSDPSPDVYLDGLMLEAEYAPVSANPNSEGESGLHAIGRGAVAGHNTAVRLGGWLEYA